MMLCERTYVVLGMHRSSTSITAKGMIHVLGEGSMGENLDEDYSEDRDFVELNDTILAKAGGTWYNPPAENTILDLRNDGELRQRVQQLVNQRNETRRFWGWKDPRTVLTINHYHHWLINPHYVCCWRSPEDIASSLTRRGDNLTHREGLSLAKIYHHRMLKFLSEVYQS